MKHSTCSILLKSKEVVYNIRKVVIIMITTGIIRRFDDLGRIAILQEVINDSKELFHIKY